MNKAKTAVLTRLARLLNDLTDSNKIDWVRQGEDLQTEVDGIEFKLRLNGRPTDEFYSVTFDGPGFSHTVKFSMADLYSSASRSADTTRDTLHQLLQMLKDSE
jgi:hypothetical protein